jgi:hypothetical protein
MRYGLINDVTREWASKAFDTFGEASDYSQNFGPEWRVAGGSFVMTAARASRAEVYSVIDGERDYQDSLVSTSETDGHHSYAEFLLYMDDYVQQAKRTASTTWGPNARIKTLDIIRKIVALGVACMEQNGAVAREAVSE